MHQQENFVRCEYLHNGSKGMGLFILKPSSDALILNQLRFAEEIRSTKGLEIPDVKTKAEVLKMAASLINQLTKPLTRTIQG
jgi:non-homologous end joining protein Ku